MIVATLQVRLNMLHPFGKSESGFVGKRHDDLVKAECRQLTKELNGKGDRGLLKITL